MVNFCIVVIVGAAHLQFKFDRPEANATVIIDKWVRGTGFHVVDGWNPGKENDRLFRTFEEAERYLEEVDP